MTSLPVPVSPVSSTGIDVGATRATCATIARRGLALGDEQCGGRRGAVPERRAPRAAPAARRRRPAPRSDDHVVGAAQDRVDRAALVDPRRRGPAQIQRSRPDAGGGHAAGGRVKTHGWRRRVLVWPRDHAGYARARKAPRHAPGRRRPHPGDRWHRSYYNHQLNINANNVSTTSRREIRPDFCASRHGAADALTVPRRTSACSRREETSMYAVLDHGRCRLRAVAAVVLAARRPDR